MFIVIVVWAEQGSFVLGTLELVLNKVVES